ncbi:hypothetical protein MMC06_001833 [Schaereria dolodes]|nr:hypothetical protein [Schaereria dolodes]
MSFFINFLYVQLFVSLPYPTKEFTGQTVIVTGSNTGLGLEAARHFTRLNAEKVILAVRNLEKGEAAKKSIEASTRKAGVVDVWQLDVSSYESVKQFANRVESLKRVDVVVQNAGITTDKFSLEEEDESVITINVVSPFLLTLLLLPKLQETAAKFNVLPRVVVVSSDLHFNTSFPERKADNIFNTLNNEKTARMGDRYDTVLLDLDFGADEGNVIPRYPVSKMMEVFIVRELGELISASSKPKVVINCLTPGFCHSDLGRNMEGPKKLLFTTMKTLLARSTEAGSRTLVAAVASGDETHGQYMADCKVKR